MVATFTLEGPTCMHFNSCRNLIPLAVEVMWAPTCARWWGQAAPFFARWTRQRWTCSMNRGAERENWSKYFS